APAVNLARRCPPGFKPEPQNRTEPLWISSHAFHSNSHAPFSVAVVKQHGRRAILRHHQVHAPVTIIISRGAPALLAINFDSTFSAIDRLETTVPIAAQKQAASGVVA